MQASRTGSPLSRGRADRMDMRDRPYSWRRRVGCLPIPTAAGPSLVPRTFYLRISGKPDMRARGMERRVAQPSVLTPGGVGAPCAGALATRRSMTAISVPGAVTSGRGREGSPPPSGQLSPPFVRAASSQLRQSPVVGTDGDPGPPECVLAKHARGRRTCPTSRTPLEAPLIGQA